MIFNCMNVIFMQQSLCFLTPILSISSFFIVTLLLHANHKVLWAFQILPNSSWVGRNLFFFTTIVLHTYSVYLIFFFGDFYARFLVMIKIRQKKKVFNLISSEFGFSFSGMLCCWTTLGSMKAPKPAFLIPSMSRNTSWWVV